MGTSMKHHIFNFCMLMVLSTCHPGVVGSTDAEQLGNFTFLPSLDELETLYANKYKEISVVFPQCAHNYSRFEMSIADSRILYATYGILPPDPKANRTCYTANVTISTRNIGTSNITFLVAYLKEDDPCTKEVVVVHDYELKVQREQKIELEIFRFGTMFFLVLLNFGFGCSLNLEVVKEILRRPFAPAVGFGCQYLLMPIIGFCVSMTLLRSNPLFGFGLICSSCSPGGSGSNVWCLLLGGDVSLSLTMTFFSVSASLVMMPLWIFLEGRFFIDTSTVEIPYLNILVNLAFFVVPCFVGILFRKFKEAGADMVGRGIKPFSLIFLIFLLSFGMYCNRYIYSIIGAYPYILLPALLQPYLGFTIGFLIARMIGRQSKQRAITIAIETGIQNITIPMVLLQNSFEQPLGDIAAVMPVTTAHFTPIPLAIAYLVIVLRGKFCPKPVEEKEVDEKPEEDAGRYLEKPMMVHVGSDPQGKNYYNSNLSGVSERDSFLGGIDRQEINKKFHDLDQETVI